MNVKIKNKGLIINNSKIVCNLCNSLVTIINKRINNDKSKIWLCNECNKKY